MKNLVSVALIALMTVACSTKYKFQSIKGEPGAPGTSCSVVQTPTGAIIACTDGTSAIIVDGQPGAPGVNATQPGLACEVYDSQSIERSNGLLKLLQTGVPKFEMVVDQFDTGDSPSVNGFPKFTPAQQALVGLEDYAIDCSGLLEVPVTGFYTLFLLADDGAKLALGNTLVLDHDGLHAPSEKQVTVLLYKGMNKINMLYFQGPHSQVALDLDWSGPNFSRKQLPASVLSH